MDAVLVPEVRNVGLHRPRADTQKVGNFLVAESLTYEVKDFAFTASKIRRFLTWHQHLILLASRSRGGLAVLFAPAP